MDTYLQAKEELRDIDSRIAALQQRKLALRQFIDLGESLFRNGPAAASAPVTPSQLAALVISPVETPTASVSRQLSSKARIILGCLTIIKDRGPTQARDLLASLESMGIEVGGHDKVGNLSALLSKSSQFQSDRKFGWSLFRSHEEKPPQGVDAPAGADLWVSQPDDA